jgi:hypothetical protein
MPITFPSQDRMLNPKGVNTVFKIAMPIISLVGFFLIFAPLSYGQKRQNYGDIWKGLDYAQRHFYLGGLQEGTHELVALRSLFDHRIPTRDPTEKALIENLNLTTRQRNLLIEIIDKRLNEILIEEFGTEAIAKVMTNIYDDPANTFLGFHDIAKIAVMKLRGKSEEDVRRELGILRRAATEVMKTQPVKP